MLHQCRVYMRMISVNKGVNLLDGGKSFFTALYKALWICVYFAI